MTSVHRADSHLRSRSCAHFGEAVEVIFTPEKPWVGDAIAITGRVLIAVALIGTIVQTPRSLDRAVRNDAPDRRGHAPAQRVRAPRPSVACMRSANDRARNPGGPSR
jgi:hypothetical protein